MRVKTGLGQDSHKFENNLEKPLILAGVLFPDERGLAANSDGDVIFHALTNAISSITTVNILGSEADKLCEKGITDSSVYLKESLKYLKDWKVSHVALSIECLTPKINPKIEDMRQCISNYLQISEFDVGITATSGEGLTEFGKGHGIQCFALVTVFKN